MPDEEAREIKPPEKHAVRSTTRDVVEAAAEAIPFAGVLTALGRRLAPSAEEKDKERWTGQVTDRVNEHDRVLRPTRTLTGATASLARWLVTNSPNGYNRPSISLEDVGTVLGDGHTKSDLLDAASELEELGLVRVSRAMGLNAFISAQPPLFAAMDKVLMGWDTKGDARALAKLIVDLDSIAASTLEQQSGFERRRFNPAFSLLLTLFDPGAASREIQPDYPTNYVSILGGTRPRLRRFIQGDD